MQTKFFISLIACFSLWFNLNAQKNWIMTNSRVVDPMRYVNVKGTPYQFEDWILGTIYNPKNKVLGEALVNYNGYTQEFEIYDGEEEYIELDDRWYSKIIIKLDEGDSIVFEKMIQPIFRGHFLEKLYEGEHVKLYRDEQKKMVEKEVQNVGKPVKFKHFIADNKFYLIKGKEVLELSKKKKKLYASLGPAKALEQYAKSNKLRLDKPDGLAKLIAFYDQQL